MQRFENARRRAWGRIPRHQKENWSTRRLQPVWMNHSCKGISPSWVDNRVGSRIIVAGRTVQDNVPGATKMALSHLAQKPRLPAGGGGSQVGAEIMVAQVEPVRTAQRGQALQGAQV